MPKLDNVIRHLPDLYGADSPEGYPGALLFRVLRCVGSEMDRIENVLFEIMKAHWVDHAGEMADLARMGALFDIRRREGEELEPYRDRLKQTIAAYLEGVGTVQVVRDITAATLGLSEGELAQRAEHMTLPLADLRRYLWASGHSSQEVDQILAGVELPPGELDIALADLDLEQTDRAEVVKHALIEIVENPPRLAVSPWREVGYLSEWPVTVEGFEPLDGEGRPQEIKPTILIAGTDDRTVNPILVNVTAETLVGFQGFVPDGSILVIYPDGSATLDGIDVTDRVYAQGVSLFDSSRFDEDAWSTQAKGTPALRRGTSTWRYMVEFGHFAPPDSDFSRFDQAMFAIPPVWRGAGFGQAQFDGSTFASRIQPKAGTMDWSRFDEAIFCLPSARVQIQWTEHQPATFVVRMPWTIIDPPEDGGGTDGETEPADPRHLVKEAVDRVRAAGVRAIVQYYTDPGLLNEEQDQQERLSTESRLLSREGQRAEDALAFDSELTLTEEQHAADRPPTTGGIFDHTRFNYSIFGEGRFQHHDHQRQQEALGMASNYTLGEEQRAAEALTFEGVFGTTYFGSSRFE